MTESPAISFDVIPATPEQASQALRQIAWKYGYLKLHRLGSGCDLTLEMDVLDEPDTPHIVGSGRGDEPRKPII